MNVSYTLRSVCLLAVVSPVMGFTFLDPAARKNEQGNALFGEAKYDSALTRYRDAQVERPSLPELHFNAGRTFYEMGQFDEAIREFGRAAESGQGDLKAEALSNLGNAHIKAGQSHEAVEAYKEALDIRPEDVATKQNLNYALSMQQQEQQQDEHGQDKQEPNKEQQSEQDQGAQGQKEQEQDGGRQDRQQDPPQQQGPPDPGEKDPQSQRQQNPQDRKPSSPDSREGLGTQDAQHPLPPGELTEEEAERVLDALQDREAEAQRRFRYRQPAGESRGKEW